MAPEASLQWSMILHLHAALRACVRDFGRNPMDLQLQTFKARSFLIKLLQSVLDQPVCILCVGDTQCVPIFDYSGSLSAICRLTRNSSIYHHVPWFVVNPVGLSWGFVTVSTRRVRRRCSNTGIGDPGERLPRLLGPMTQDIEWVHGMDLRFITIMRAPKNDDDSGMSRSSIICVNQWANSCF